MAQALLLLLAILVLVLGFSWPTGGSHVNESWFTLSPARNALLAVAAALFGALSGAGPGSAHSGASLTGGAVSSQWLREARATLAALLAWSLLTLPFEVATHAASYPDISLGWALLVSLLTVPAYFGLGMLLHRVAVPLHIAWALPLLVPAAVIGLAWLDLGLGSSLFNPWTASLSVSFYPAVAGAGALLTILTLVLHGRVTERSARGASKAAP